MGRPIDYTCINKYNDMHIRKGPGLQYDAVGILPKGTTIICTEEENLWYKHNKGGWSSNAGWKYLSIIEDRSDNVQKKDTTQTNTQQQTAAASTPVEEEYADFDMSTFTYDDYNKNIASSAFTQLRGIHGLPYQWMDSVDRRVKIDGKSAIYGRTFTDRIITKFPVLVLSPGKPGFMKGFNKNERDNIIQKIASLSSGVHGTSLEDLISKDQGRYYTFEFDYKSYYQYVNGMVRQSALMLGIGHDEYRGVKLARYDWSEHVENGLKGFFTGNEYVCFYIEADNQISESFSNSTGESILEGVGNKFSDMGKEFQFLLGAGAGVDWDFINPEKQDELDEGLIGEFSKKYAGGILDRMKSGLDTVRVGGQLIIPKIWKDSSNSRSYDVTVKFASPDGDDYSVFLNTLVPLYHLLALVMPRAINPNSFYSPFLVRGFYKGYFNCDLGMITDMTITRGSEGGWNINGLPTEIEVRFTITDLYDQLAMSTPYNDSPNVENPFDHTKVLKFLKNTPYLDYLANMVGINLNTPELDRNIKYYVLHMGNKVLDVKQNFLLSYSNAASNLLRGIMGR